MIIAVVAAWQLCFGDKPITCEAWQRVYTCDKYGCVEYGILPIKPPPPPKDNCVYKNGKREYCTVTFDNSGGIGFPQLEPNGSGLLRQMCEPANGHTMCTSGAGAPDIPEFIPQSDFKPVQP